MSIPKKPQTISESPRLPPERPGQPGGKRDLNRRRRVEQLQQAGLTLFLQRGVDAVTIDDIAKEAGTAKGNFYRYFEDKGDLVSSIMEDVNDKLFKAFDDCEAALERAHDDTSLIAAYQALAVGFIPITVESPNELRLYLQESRAPSVGDRAALRAIADRVRERAVDLTEFAVDHGLLKIRDPRISAVAVVGAVEQLVWAVLGGHLDAPAHEIAGSLITLVLRGIRS